MRISKLELEIRKQIRIYKLKVTYFLKVSGVIV